MRRAAWRIALLAAWLFDLTVFYGLWHSPQSTRLDWIILACAFGLLMLLTKEEWHTWRRERDRCRLTRPSRLPETIDHRRK